mgnify:CR=1 FL=1
MELPSLMIVSDILAYSGKDMVAEYMNMPDGKFIEVFSEEKRMILFLMRSRCVITCILLYAIISSRLHM